MGDAGTPGGTGYANWVREAECGWDAGWEGAAVHAPKPTRSPLGGLGAWAAATDRAAKPSRIPPHPSRTRQKGISPGLPK